MTSEYTEPFNIGNPEEISIIDFVAQIAEATNSSIEIEEMPLPEDDPKVRRPDVSKAKELLGWEPKVSLREGLKKPCLSFGKSSHNVQIELENNISFNICLGVANLPKLS